MPRSASRVRCAAIALGSNLPSAWGGREETLRLAIVRMGAFGRVTAVSSFLDTAPVLYTSQPRFLNGAVLLETTLEPLPLLRELQAIEEAMGRDRSGTAIPKGPRTLDLDLLWLDDLVLQTAELVLPHPSLEERGFVLEPLAEIAPGWRHPVSQRTAAELLARLTSGASV